MMSEKHVDDYWNVDGGRELSDAWTGFTRIIVFNEKQPDGYTWSRERLTRKQTTSRPDTVWPDMWKGMSDASKRKTKQTWAVEKPKLDNARRQRGIFSVEPDDEEFKRTMKKARRKLEILVPAATPCRIQLHQHRENLWHSVEADETMRIRMEGSQSKNHEDHISGKDVNSLSDYNLVHKFILVPKAMKISDAEAAVEKEWEKLETVRAWQQKKVKSNKEVILEAQRDKNKVHFATLMDLCHLKKFGV